ncbi:MAG: serine hydrolase domain-containing protein [Salinibacter sp.]
MRPPLSLSLCSWTARLLVIALLAVGPAQRATAQNMATVDSLARTFKTNTKTPGLVVGAIEGSTSQLFQYGVATLADSTALRADTRFEIGSVTKVFTTLLLAEMAHEGDVSLRDPIGKYLPDSVDTPGTEGEPIELRHLATHTSGLPRLPTNLTPVNRSDPYAAYTAKKLHAFLETATLSAPPGSTYTYSNVGMGLLGHLLARHADTTYAAALRARVLAPLRLHDTGVPLPSDTTGPRLARGYTPLSSTPYWFWDVLAGAGALRSTPPDMLHFLRANLDPEQSPLSSAIKQTHRLRHRKSKELALALGWHVSKGPDGSRIYWQNGGTGGFRSFVGVHRDDHTALLLLTNQALSPRRLNEFAFQLMRILLQSEE